MGPVFPLPYPEIPLFSLTNNATFIPYQPCVCLRVHPPTHTGGPPLPRAGVEWGWEGGHMERKQGVSSLISFAILEGRKIQEAFKFPSKWSSPAPKMGNSPWISTFNFQALGNWTRKAGFGSLRDSSLYHSGEAWQGKQPWKKNCK